MAMKCSERRIILRRAQNLVNYLVELNEEASRQAAMLVAAGSADVGDTINKILAAGGPPTVLTAIDTSDTMTGEIMNVLNGTVIDPTYGAIDWVYEAE